MDYDHTEEGGQGRKALKSSPMFTSGRVTVTQLRIRLERRCIEPIVETVYMFVLLITMQHVYACTIQLL